jgi:hypothetical protein
VGNLAVLEGGTGTFDSYNLERHRVCLLTAIALEAGNYRGTVITGLPISEMHHKSNILKLIGEYKVNLNGKDYTVQITNIMVLPQAGACFFDLLLNDKGEPIGDLDKKKVGILDVGEKTADYCCFDNMQFINEKSGSINSGIYKANRRLLEKLQKIGINCKIHEVKKFLSRIPQETQKEYDNLADEILSEVSAWWNIKEFDKIFIVGGGGIVLYDYLNRRVKCSLVPDAQFANVRGYHKCGAMKNF